MQITNCHVHTFTHEHAPDRFVPWPLGKLLEWGPLRRWVLGVVHDADGGRRGAVARYAQILEMSYKRDQGEVLDAVSGYYPSGTRFVVLPMDMTFMGAGQVARSIDEQHEELADLRDACRAAGRDVVIPFAAVDPRHEHVVEKTKRLIEDRDFRGIKLYPPIGYHPNDPELWDLYAYAEERGVPVLTHCSRPAGVQYRGEPTERMLTDPLTGAPLNLGRVELLTLFTDPDAYVPILQKHPRLRLCLAHFGGAGDWNTYLKDQWHQGGTARKSWLAKILDLLRSGAHPNLYTDIAYTLYADDEYVYLLKVLLSDDRVAARVMFGSDFYVVDQAKLEERHRSVRIRAVIGEDLFRRIAYDNPRSFLGETP